MKRILNLNDFSVPALKGIGIIGLGLPGALLLLSWGLDQAGLHLEILIRAARGLFVVGCVLFGLFILLVIVEQIQDQVLYRRYLRRRSLKTEGECPYCGNRQVRPFERDCPVCGKRIQ